MSGLFSILMPETDIKISNKAEKMEIKMETKIETQILILEDYKKSGVISAADAEKIKIAADIIRNGGLAAIPTETVYGLAGNALMKEASKKIYAAKGRPSDNPLIVHISDISELGSIVKEIPEKAALLAEHFWPGPMTMIFKKADIVPYETTGGLDTVAVRFPSHPVAMMIIREAGVPVAAPSANISGRPSTTSGEHCIEDLSGRVEAIVDGGSSDIGLESTIIDVTGDTPQLLRPGAVTKEMLENVLGVNVTEDIALKGPLAEGERPKAPGMKYRHYAPKAQMVLVTAHSKEDVCGISKKILELIKTKEAEHKKTALLCSEECLNEIKNDLDKLAESIDIKITGSRDDVKGIAHGLFEYLREFDSDGIDYIVAEGYSEEELGQAVMNRLKKAAAWQLIYV